MLMSRLFSLARKLLMLVLMLASLVRTGLKWEAVTCHLSCSVVSCKR